MSGWMRSTEDWKTASERAELLRESKKARKKRGILGATNGKETAAAAVQCSPSAWRGLGVKKVAVCMGWLHAASLQCASHRILTSKQASISLTDSLRPSAVVLVWGCEKREESNQDRTHRCIWFLHFTALDSTPAPLRRYIACAV